MPQYRSARLFVSLAALIVCSTLAHSAQSAEDEVAKPSAEQVQFFESKVRPVLVENCLKCHGPDKQKSNLRLDSLSAALTGGDMGAAVVPGKPEESLLVTAIRHDDDTLKMPPSKKLAPQQIADLTRWVQIGSPWPGGTVAAAGGAGTRKGAFEITDKDRAHWAFQPVRRPIVPSVSNPAWIRNTVDTFILSGLDANGLRPNPPASKHELVRRAYYALTGLPPTPQDVDAFLTDPAPDAYESLIDRLLSSPRYGEKWARHWLDLVRFAETNSFERDNPKPSAWRFRDYVVRSLNQDKPYDRFVREQLAGDELFRGDVDALIGTGFYRLGIWDDEPVDREQARYDAIDDIVATTSQVFLGLTVDCARCHDHKIDPIPQKDYYRLVSFFQNINHFRNGGPTDEALIFTVPGSKEDYEAKVAEQARQSSELQAKISAIEADFLARSSADQAVQADLDDLTYRLYRDTYDRLPDFSGIKPEKTDELETQRFDLSPRSRDDAFGLVFEGVLIVPKDGTYTFYLDSDDGSRLTVAGQTVIEYDGVHELGNERSASVELSSGRLPIRLDYFQKTAKLGLRVGWSGPGFLRRSLSADGPDTQRNSEDLALLIRAKGVEALGQAQFDAYWVLKRQLSAIKKAKPTTETALCVTEQGTSAADTHVLLRGNAAAPGEKVEPGFLSVLGSPEPVVPTPPPGSKTTGRRAVLADWIISPENPLTPRVIVNRLWQHHFGRGIVRSSSNFGSQGDRPTQPELLDWLASELVAGGWRLKPLHRLIMTSNTYRMSSRSDPEALAKDPTNNAFWRFDMRRLSAEEIRDSILAVCGTLNPAMYGPGVYPEIPAEVLAGQSQPGKGWPISPPAEQTRRSVYVHVKRSLLLPLIETFDAAETDRSSPVRFSTTQPTQALAMLNGRFLNDQARALAKHLKREAGDDPSAQVRLALRLVACREPSEAEVQRGVAMMGTLAGTDNAKSDQALAALSLVVLNLNEFLFLD
jgi:cytochrome c553